MDELFVTDAMREEEMREPASVNGSNYDERELTPGQAGEGRQRKRDRRPRHARKSFGLSAGSVIAGVVLGSIVVCVIANLHDIRRYIRISTM
jgi:hypothetical protein